MVNDVHIGHLGSLDVLNSFFSNNLRLKRAGDVRDVLLSLSRHDSSIDMPQGLLGSSRDIDLMANVNLTFKGHHAYILTCFVECNTISPALSLAFLVQKLFAKKNKYGYFDLS